MSIKSLRSARPFSQELGEGALCLCSGMGDVGHPRLPRAVWATHQPWAISMQRKPVSFQRLGTVSLNSNQWSGFLYGARAVGV